MEGGAAFKSRRYQEAHDIYTEALKIDPLNKSAMTKLHYNIATVAAKVSENLVKNVYRIFCNLCNIVNFVFIQLGNLSESISECTEALKLDAEYLKAILRRAQCFMELKRFEEAVRDYENAYRIDKAFCKFWMRFFAQFFESVSQKF